MEVLWILIFCFFMLKLVRQLTRTEFPFHWPLGMDTKEFVQTMDTCWLVTTSTKGDPLIFYITSPLATMLSICHGSW